MGFNINKSTKKRIPFTNSTYLYSLKNALMNNEEIKLNIKSQINVMRSSMIISFVSDLLSPRHLFSMGKIGKKSFVKLYELIMSYEVLMLLKTTFSTIPTPISVDVKTIILDVDSSSFFRKVIFKKINIIATHNKAKKPTDNILVNSII